MDTFREEQQLSYWNRQPIGTYRLLINQKPVVERVCFWDRCHEMVSLLLIMIGVGSYSFHPKPPCGLVCRFRSVLSVDAWILELESHDGRQFFSQCIQKKKEIDC